MIGERIVSHLKLVSSNTEADHEVSLLAHSAESKSAQGQLALPYHDAFSVLLLDVRRLNFGRFVDVLNSTRPNWIIDVRVTPRMDLLAGNRQHALKIFSSHNAEYVDLFGKLGLHSYQSAEANPALWSKTIGEIVLNSRRPSGPFIVLFDDDKQFEFAKKIVPHSFGSIFQKPVFVSYTD
ncbi:hypothetical protein [Dongia sp.]|uniref:hypothetical protein n=1 Tax=Dongia sp. TaxID=1977262 RepID=UPI0035AE9C05